MTSLNRESDTRKRLEDLQLNISILNDEKAAIVRAWEGEKERLNDPEMEAPQELKGLNKRLGLLYGAREDILREHPQFEAEFGGRKKGSTKNSPLGTSAMAQARKSEKKAKYLANREARREANRAARNRKGK